MKNKDDYIISKNISKDEKAKTITLRVQIRPADKPRGLNLKQYTNADARRWLTEGGVEFGNIVNGCKTHNSVPGVGTWVFELPQEVVRETKRSVKVKKTEVDTTATATVAETTVELVNEFDGLNYDGEGSEPATKKTTTKRKRKSTRK
jgi:hypothetical protein